MVVSVWLTMTISVGYLFLEGSEDLSFTSCGPSPLAPTMVFYGHNHIIS